jgi:lambda repressor-like predicted transcriptional regulator
MARPRHNQAVQRDWTALDFVIALRQRRLTWRTVSERAGYAGTGARKVIYQSWPEAEKRVAGILCVPAEAIWPSRYPAQKDAA